MSTTAPTPSSSSAKSPASDPKDYSTYSIADDLTVGQYHDYVEKSIDAVLDECEQLTEQYDDDGSWEVEYAQGVLNFKHPSGTWVLNRQPPTKQLWLSSPKSGPKRFDYSHAVPTPEENMGTWVCTKEGQTYSLRDILEAEFGELVGDSSFRVKGMYHDAER